MNLSVNGKPLGRPKGTGKPMGPRPGSRLHMLANMKPGQRVFLEVPAGRLQAFMAQVGTDISRGKLGGLITQALILGINPTTRQVIDLVMLTRKEST
mgnify:FL=1